jgi:hypothetical protein
LKKIALLVENDSFSREVIGAGSPEKVNRIIKKYEEMTDT